MTDRVGDTHRREFLQAAAAATGSALISASSGLLVPLPAFAQDPPAHCPTPPTGGTHFVPGQDKRPIGLRKPIGALSAAEVTQLRKAYTNLRALPATDNRTWVIQADLHALYCRQCTNDSAQIHGSWTFFPWHRAYLYYYERILGSLVNDLDGFRLPYWEWESERTLPTSYRTPAAASNSLWDDKRNGGLAGGGQLPPNDGTSARITFLNSITDFATFGGTASGGGACESNPHNIIHNDTGLPTSPYHDMGNLGYAARDPIFFGHHGNIDKIWSRWNAHAAGSGLPPDAYKNPTSTAFLNSRWSFYDENQKVVSISASDVLDHRTDLRYTYDLLALERVPFLVAYACELIIGPDPEVGATLRVDEAVRANVLTAVRQNAPTALVLEGVQIPAEFVGNFDIFAVKGDRRILLGTIGLMSEVGHGMERAPQTIALDVTEAAADLLATSNPASIRVVPRDGGKAFPLKAAKAEIRMQRR